MPKFAKILVPTDFSERAAGAVRHAKSIGEKFGSEIRLLHVLPDMSVVLPEAVVPAPVQPPDMAELQANAVDGLKKVVQEFGLDKLNVTFEARIGSPADEIVDAAKGWGADLVSLGTHGRTGLSHLLLGSVAERVVRTAPCPVLTCRPTATAT
jgi:nucleotide-binding universal stress UspA family protein